MFLFQTISLQNLLDLFQWPRKILDNLDKKLITGAVFIDLRKAFDTVDHALLISKLKRLGFSSPVLNWFTSYLSSRTQVTTVNNSTSSPRPITVGVPQGSILGPLLFLIYINDLPKCLNHSKSILYADDTLLYYSAKTSKLILIQIYNRYPIGSTKTSSHLIMKKRNSCSLQIKKFKVILQYKYYHQ